MIWQETATKIWENTLQISTSLPKCWLSGRKDKQSPMGTCNEGSTWRTLFSAQQNPRVWLWVLLVMVYVVILEESIVNIMITSIWPLNSSSRDPINWIKTRRWTTTHAPLQFFSLFFQFQCHLWMLLFFHFARFSYLLYPSIFRTTALQGQWWRQFKQTNVLQKLLKILLWICAL